MASGYRYPLAFTVPLTVWAALHAPGAWTFLPLYAYFGLVPAPELATSPRRDNLDDGVRGEAVAARRHDAMLYAVAPFQVGTLLMVPVQVQEPGPDAMEIAGRTVSMGLTCGILGIDAGHDPGHRRSRFARFPGDVYLFWLRSHAGGWTQARRIERDRLATPGVRERSPARFARNAMVVWTSVQPLVPGAIGTLAGPLAPVAFLGAATIGIALLETVNHIEHYGLVRVRAPDGRHERVRHRHSWNSDHPIGRSLPFELSRSRGLPA